MAYMPGHPVFLPTDLQEIERHLRLLADHEREIRRAQAAGVDTADHLTRNHNARVKLQAIVDTYFDPTKQLQ